MTGTSALDLRDFLRMTAIAIAALQAGLPVPAFAQPDELLRHLSNFFTGWVRQSRRYVGGAGALLEAGARSIAPRASSAPRCASVTPVSPVMSRR